MNKYISRNHMSSKWQTQFPGCFKKWEERGDSGWSLYKCMRSRFFNSMSSFPDSQFNWSCSLPSPDVCRDAILSNCIPILPPKLVQKGYFAKKLWVQLNSIVDDPSRKPYLSYNISWGVFPKDSFSVFQTLKEQGNYFPGKQKIRTAQVINKLKKAEVSALKVQLLWTGGKMAITPASLSGKDRGTLHGLYKTSRHNVKQHAHMSSIKSLRKAQEALSPSTPSGDCILSCKWAYSHPACLSFQIITIPSAPFHVRKRGKNVLLESNSMSIWRRWGLLSCSQMSLSSTLYPPQWPSQQSWALSEMAVKCTVKRRDGKILLNGKGEAHQPDSAVRVVGLFINDQQRVCHLYRYGVDDKDKRGWWGWAVGKESTDD